MPVPVIRTVFSQDTAVAPALDVAIKKEEADQEDADSPIMEDYDSPPEKWMQG